MLARRSNRRKKIPNAQGTDREKILLTDRFWRAAKRDDLQVTKNLIDKDVAVNYSELGVTSLHWAAKHGSMEMANILLASGADPDAQDNNGWSVLIYAASFGNVQMVTCLLELDIDPNRADDEGTTALSTAAEKGHEAMVHLVLQTCNCDPNMPDNDGGTPISWAAWNGHLRIVQILANHGALPDLVDTRWGRTPLSWAAENGHWEVMEFLIVQKRVEPDSVASEGGRTPAVMCFGKRTSSNSCRTP